MSMLDCLVGATRNDLDELEQEIDVVRRRLDSLMQLRRVVRLHLGIQTRKRGGGGNAQSPQRRLDALHYLVKNGVAKQAVIAAEIGIPNGTLSHLLNHPWFERTPKGVTLTEEGRRAGKGE